jgi:uncharacterized repeat protein (TIGR01451 family)
VIRFACKALLALVVLLAAPVYANWCATPGKNGTASLSGVVNSYYPGTGSPAAGATSIGVGSIAAGGSSTPIAAGDLLLVIQMQDATIDTRNSNRYGDGGTAAAGSGYLTIGQAGRYEYVRATGAVSGGSVPIVGATGGGLVNSYSNVAMSETGYRKSFQVIRVPQYDQATVSGTVLAKAWDGSTGGVVVFDVARRLTFLGGTVSASGLGFRGGGGVRLTGGANGLSTDYARTANLGFHASKGEGLVGTPRYVSQQGSVIDNLVEGLPGGSFGRGAPGNAGGGGSDGNTAANDENTGGGGGANVGNGGLGGHAWCSTAPTGCEQTGGHAGAAIKSTDFGVSRIHMGGGGGAGTNNNGTGSGLNGASSSGAAGGGIVLIRAAEIAGSGAIAANGASADSSILNDSSGGGGAGGTILVSALRSVGTVSISASANGGNGGTNTGGGAAHGPGGGGGGGFIASSAGVSLVPSVAGGSAGTTANGGSFGSSYGALGGTSGSNGLAISGANIPGISSGGECTPTITKEFATSPVPVGGTTRLSITVTNYNPTVSLTSLAFTDTYPSGLVNAATPAAAKSCTTAASMAAAANGASFAVSGGTIAALSSCTYSVTTRVTSIGDKTNNIPAGGLTARAGTTYSVASLEAASDVVQVSAPLTILKSSTAYSDPLNGTANAKAIPGGFIAYTVTVANPGSGTVDTDTIVVVDATPANLNFFAGDVPGGSGPLMFVQGATASGLSYTYGGLSSTTDDIEFSNNGGSSWTYVPVPNALGVDPAITHFRVRPKGAMVGNSSFSLQFGYMIK